YINKFKGYNGSFWEHYKTVIELQWFPQGAFHWLHLWFLAFIFAYSIVIIPLMQWLKTSRGEKVLQNIIDVVSEPSALFSLMFLLQTPYYIIDSILPASDIAALAQYFPFFLFGAVLSTDPAIRETLAANAGKALIFGIAALTCLYLFFWIKGSSGERLFLFDQDIKRYPANAIFMLLKTGNQWFWLIAILGASIRFFKRGSTALTYANQAVYPFYIFHQTVIIIAGYYVVQTSWNPLIKFSIILGAAFLFILLIYELLLKRTELTRLMFGIKTPTKEKQG